MTMTCGNGVWEMQEGAAPRALTLQTASLSMLHEVLLQSLNTRVELAL